VIGCYKRDFALSKRQNGGLPVERLLVRIHGQQEDGPCSVSHESHILKGSGGWIQLIRTRSVAAKTLWSNEEPIPPTSTHARSLDKTAYDKL
jgi:hypothetical protein